MHTFVSTCVPFYYTTKSVFKCEIVDEGPAELQPYKFRTAADFVKTIVVHWMKFKEEECRKNGKPYVGAFSFGSLAPLNDICIPGIERYRIMELDTVVGDRTLTYIIKNLLPLAFQQLVKSGYLTINQDGTFRVIKPVNSIYCFETKPLI